MRKSTTHCGILAILIPFFFLSACQKNDELSSWTDTPEDINICFIYTLTAGSVIITSKNDFIQTSEMGVCWSDQNLEPTILDSKKAQEGSKKVFTVGLDHLEDKRVYRTRAYAIVNGIPQYSRVMIFEISQKRDTVKNEL
jgi:hypothetical protein